MEHELARVEAFSDLRIGLPHYNQRTAQQKQRAGRHPQALVTALEFGLLMFQPFQPRAQLACRLLHNPRVAESLDARQFVLHDSSGKVRGALGLTDDGAVGLNLVDAKDKTRMTLDIPSNGTPGLDFFDQDGKLRATFALGPDGTPGLGLYDPEGHLRTSLDVPASKTPGLAFYHQDGKPAWGAP